MNGEALNRNEDGKKDWAGVLENEMEICFGEMYRDVVK